jgi:DNA-binding NtrC family response regulator
VEVLPSLKLSLLIVEDDPLVVRLLVRSFRKLPLTIRCESNATSAYAALEAEAFDMVWSDLNLGYGGNGVDVLVRAHELLPNALLIIVTGSIDLMAVHVPPKGARVFAKNEINAALRCVREHVERRSPPT